MLTVCNGRVYDPTNRVDGAIQTIAVEAGPAVLFGLGDGSPSSHSVRCLMVRETDKTVDFAAWLYGAAKGHAIKLVNPGGVEVWKDTGHNVARIDDPVEAFGVTPRQIIVGLADAATELGLPNPIHIHA